MKDEESGPHRVLNSLLCRSMSLGMQFNLKCSKSSLLRVRRCGIKIRGGAQVRALGPYRVQFAIAWAAFNIAKPMLRWFEKRGRPAVVINNMRGNWPTPATGIPKGGPASVSLAVEM
jgi:hypothetical protein